MRIPRLLLRTSVSETNLAADIFVRVFGNGDKDVPGSLFQDKDVRKSGYQIM